MKQKLQFYIHSIRQVFQPGIIINNFLSLVVATSVFTFIILNRSPNFLRTISLPLRAGLDLTVGLYFVVLYFAFRLQGRFGQFFSLTLTLALFAFPLASLWAIGQSQPTVFNGIVPLFDAAEYYGDALRLLTGQNFSVFSSRRPLFPGLLSAVLWVSNHNLLAALSILTALTALACFAAVKEIQRTHGTEVAVFVLIILFLFYRYHSGLTMSENLGLPLGALGFAVLWRGIAEHSRFSTWVGLFLFTLALNARAGTFFMLPLLIVWGGWVLKTSSQKISWFSLALSTSAVILGFVINMVMFRLLASPSGVPFANFSYSLYGLASGGKSWIYVFESHPWLYQLQEPYQSREIYRMAFDLIRHQPALLVRGALYNWSMLFSDSWYSAYSFVSGESHTIGMIAQWTMLFLCALGFIRWARKPDDHLNGLVCIAAVGILVSVPFLPPSDAYRMRPYATSMIVFGLLPAMGLLFAMEIFKLPRVEGNSPDNTYLPIQAFVIVLLLFSSTLGPVLIKSFGELPHFQGASCESNLDLISIRFDPGTYFNVIRQKDPGLDWMPDFHIGRFRTNSHSLADPDLISWTESIRPGTSIFYTLDFQSMKNMLVVVPTDRLPVGGTLWQVCGERETDPNLATYNIFYVRTEAKVEGQ